MKCPVCKTSELALAPLVLVAGAHRVSPPARIFPDPPGRRKGVSALRSASRAGRGLRATG